MKLLIALCLSLVATLSHARSVPLADDVAGIRLGDSRAVEESLDRRARAFLRVYYDENEQVVAVRYRQPGLSNERSFQTELVNRLCSKYGETNFCSIARSNIQQQSERAWVGFSTLYEMEDGSRINARITREDTFSFFPRLAVEIEMFRPGFTFP